MPIDYVAQAERLRLLAHAERLRILDAVRREAECVCHLEALLGKPQPYVSQQLRLLREAGAIADERRGQNIYYRLADESLRAWLDTMLGPVDGGLAEIEVHKQAIACACPKCAGAHDAPQPIELALSPDERDAARTSQAAITHSPFHAENLP